MKHAARGWILFFLFERNGLGRAMLFPLNPASLPCRTSHRPARKKGIHVSGREKMIPGSILRILRQT